MFLLVLLGILERGLTAIKKISIAIPRILKGLITIKPEVPDLVRLGLGCKNSVGRIDRKPRQSEHLGLEPAALQNFLSPLW